MFNFESTVIWSIFAAVLGLIFGSFANVIIYRLPLGESVVSPRSRCPQCRFSIPWYLNVPVFSWLYLRGKCGECRSAISLRYPIVEILMSVTFTLLFMRYGWQWVTLEYLLLGFGLITVSFIDLDHMILPDQFTLSGIALGVFGAVVNPERDVISSLAGLVMGGGFLWAIAVLYYSLRKVEGLGGGDIKLLAWIGSVLGWTSVPFVILASSLLGAVVGIGLGFRSGNVMRTAIPFGPFISLAALAFLLGGDHIGLWYVSLFIPSLVGLN